VTEKSFRKFLNRDRTLTAFVAWRVGKDDASFTLKDCTRESTLEFWGEEPGTLEKLAILEDAVAKFGAALRAALEAKAKRGRRR